ncbi:hypothetical protein SPRG_19835 [Saprolegnia parasitica CBS 223.65]|uniref:Uncharacterized protein n=1 Tax=Saprolegnia parasitica (strain CBS 223.65) TaxID=695850 RepID=A0A067CU25_SAPPC|nr:hypothetical protein SPRG_19835 [Saprolegnia parasitica CBS 223.65]KDO30287.1 hypothetical protein SPRG_19835 [Saprolegnia parasitica CBS 223.65]|eukprot:XP_012199083.1 hypothetical protein SPRG_19835 [Saprolegnia parasitica CBS 223.65]
MDGTPDAQSSRQLMRPPDDNMMEARASEIAAPADIAYDERASAVYTPQGTDDGGVRSVDDTAQAKPSSALPHRPDAATKEVTDATADAAPPDRQQKTLRHVPSCIYAPKTTPTPRETPQLFCRRQQRRVTARAKI